MMLDLTSALLLACSKVLRSGYLSESLLADLSVRSRALRSGYS